MNKQLFLDVASNLVVLANSIEALANAFNEAEPKQDVKQEPKQESKPITLEQVRTALAEKSKDGFTDEIKKLIEKHGAIKLSDIHQSKFEALLKDVEALTNA